MKIVVSDLPKQPQECLFSKWNCEYGWLCNLFKYEPCYVNKNLDCPYLKEETVIPAEPPMEEA